jgi:large-conductance mechanosensitive channel
MSDMKEQLKQFIINNGIIGTSAGVCIALVTKDVIQSLVADIVIPVIIVVLSLLKLKVLINILPKHDKNNINVVNFINQLITWFLVIIITFLFIQYSIKYLLGIDNIADKNIKKVEKPQPNYS